MLSQSRFSYLIDLSQKIVAAVQTMASAYRLFPALIEEEHEMIRAHTYTERLEAVMKQKSDAGDVIVAAFEELQQISQQLYAIWTESECEGQARFPGDLSNCITMLEGILETLGARASGLALGVLQLQIHRLKDAHRDFTDVMIAVKPKIEVNRLAISTIAQNYQASTRMLIELCEQAQATYAANGQQNRPSTGTSTIFVKA